MSEGREWNLNKHPSPTVTESVIFYLGNLWYRGEITQDAIFTRGPTQDALHTEYWSRMMTV
jgi:hypothetical protein